MCVGFLSPNFHVMIGRGLLLIQWIGLQERNPKFMELKSLIIASKQTYPLFQKKTLSLFKTLYYTNYTNTIQTNKLGKKIWGKAS